MARLHEMAQREYHNLRDWNRVLLGNVNNFFKRQKRAGSLQGVDKTRTEEITTIIKIDIYNRPWLLDSCLEVVSIDLLASVSMIGYPQSRSSDLIRPMQLPSLFKAWDKYDVCPTLWIVISHLLHARDKKIVMID
ncbi:Protein spaetzle [Temnothorax longispinosus]|uniref:Protein spaetzle n=1 Tax=Temnothorax longispinosus TaxID=300112 RepID=A0A4S2JAQ8_9HYME|nr:Protein spaetzle [Temnothorax longispinosus]